MLFLFCFVFGQWLVREAHLRRFASPCAALFLGLASPPPPAKPDGATPSRSPCELGLLPLLCASKARKSSTSATSTPSRCPFTPKFPVKAGNFGIVAEYTLACASLKDSVRDEPNRAMWCFHLLCRLSTSKSLTVTSSLPLSSYMMSNNYSPACYSWSL